MMMSAWASHIKIERQKKRHRGNEREMKVHRKQNLLIAPVSTVAPGISFSMKTEPLESEGLNGRHRSFIISFKTKREAINIFGYNAPSLQVTQIYTRIKFGNQWAVKGC